MEYQRDEHRVHLIVYHLIWCPKRRKPVLMGEVATAGNVSAETIQRYIEAQKGI